MDSQPTQPTQPPQAPVNQASSLETWMFVWIVALAVFLLVPICATDYRRRLCLRRLKERRWNVSVDGGNDEWPGSSNGNRQTTIPDGGDDKNVKQQLSKQEEEEIRQIFLSDLLKRYSKPLSKADIRRKSKINLGGNDVPRDGPKSEQVAGAPDNVTSSVVTSGFSKVDDRLPNDSNRSLPSSLSPGLDDIESTIVVPLSGATCRSSTESVETREVPNGCSICYCEYGAEEVITWSSNPECAHVFHEDCAMTWFMTVGKKELRRRRRAGIEPSSSDPVEQVKDFPILCPCCRQTFVSAVPEEDPMVAKNDTLSDCLTSRTAESSPSTTDEEPHVFGDENV